MEWNRVGHKAYTFNVKLFPEANKSYKNVLIKINKKPLNNEFSYRYAYKRNGWKFLRNYGQNEET